MAAPSTEHVYCNPDNVEPIADPYPLFKRMRERCIPTIQKETAS